MKKILIFLPCLIVLLTLSCDKRNSKSEHLKRAVSEFNTKFQPLPLKTYYPEYYTEIKSDSIIANTFKVSLKHYSSDASIPIKKDVESPIKEQQFHRIFECDMIVSYQDNIIVDKRISAALFSDKNKDSFWQNATLEHVWVNQEFSNRTKLYLGISFVDPNSKAFKLYEMSIDHYGNEQLKLIEEHS